MSGPPPADRDPGRYGRSFADVYDTWYAEVPTDDLVLFVSDRIPPGATVLELGVGTGRVAIPLAAAGFRVIGIDSSNEMLDRLRAKDGAAAVDTLLGDCSDPDTFPVGSADAVLAVYNLLFNLVGDADQERCLQGAARALRPGGVVVIEAFVPDAPDADETSARRRDLVTRSVGPDGVVLIATDADPATGIVSGSHIEITDTGTRLRPWSVRPFVPAAIDTMARATGLELVERYEDFGGRPFVDDTSSHHVSVYRRAEES